MFIFDQEHQLVASQHLENWALLRNRVFSPGFRLFTRIGINSGHVVAAHVGSEDRVKYTVHGDNINLAMRLVGLNKQYGKSVLIPSAQHDSSAITGE